MVGTRAVDGLWQEEGNVFLLLAIRFLSGALGKEVGFVIIWDVDRTIITFI